MTTSLSELGSFRIERSEEYDQCPFDKSYCELIRVKGSRPEPSYNVVSHLYKYSESELCLYLKDKKNIWRALGKLLNEDIDISENELILKFPVSKFKQVSRMVHFVRKKTRINPMSEQERESRRKHMQKLHHIMKQKEPDSVITDTGKAITLDTFEGGNL